MTIQAGSYKLFFTFANKTGHSIQQASFWIKKRDFETLFTRWEQAAKTQFMQVGSTAFRAGFVTRQINIQGQSLAEIETRLGFHKGRLSKGAYFLVAEELPKNEGFLFAGYTQVADHRTANVYGNINNDSDPYYDGRKSRIAQSWSLSGTDRLVKVIPVTEHDENMSPDQQYVPGSGIPQWKLTRAIQFRVEAFVNDYPSGRFIPSQGFKAIKYT